MFKIFLKNKKAQNTAEYALLIALVIAAAIAMQLYVQRGMQAKMRDGILYMVSQTCSQGFGNAVQYEPYYLQSNYNIDRTSAETVRLDGTSVAGDGKDVTSNRIRKDQGFQASSYCATTVGTGSLATGL